MLRFLSVLLGLSLVLFANSASAKRTNQLQIGEQWSRFSYQNQLTTNESVNAALKATARIDLPDERGTAFYVGKFLGRHIMATNFHVLSSTTACRHKKTSVYFQYLDKDFSCAQVIATFKQLELTFFAISVSRHEDYLFEGLALKFDFFNYPAVGERIVTVGYGNFKNAHQRLTYESSATCRVATSINNPRLIRVKMNYKAFEAWSFVHSCEISPGDSGSALVSESTGKVIGINWATAFDKPQSLLNTNTVYEWIEQQNPELWPSMSLGVPNSKILSAIQAEQNRTLLEFVRSNL